jgi:hypothetical protein
MVGENSFRIEPIEKHAISLEKNKSIRRNPYSFYLFEPHADALSILSIIVKLPGANVVTGASAEMS